MQEKGVALEKTGIFTETMCLSCHRKYPFGSLNPKTRRMAHEIMEKAICLAVKAGVRIIQLAGYDVFYEPSTKETREYFKKGLEHAADMAARAGILLGFETMDTEFMDTIGKAMAIVQGAASPYLHIYPDLGNLTNAAKQYGISLTQDFEAGRGSIIALHLKETAPGRFRNVPFGSGHVNFQEGIFKAWSLGVRRFVAEFWYDGKDNWRETLKSVRSMMTDILEHPLDYS